MQLKKNLQSKTVLPVSRTLRHPEKKSKQFYESFTVYDKKTQEAILTDLPKRLGSVGEKYIDCANVSLVFDNIVRFLKKTANQRASLFHFGVVLLLSSVEEVWSLKA